MDITKRLMDKDDTLRLHNEGDWSNSFDSNKLGYSSFNDAGVETETGEFLYAMTRILKPNRVLETGTHWGIGTSYIASALRDNHNGHLDTIEFNADIQHRALVRITDLGLTDWVSSYLQDAATFKPDNLYKLVLLDTEPQIRFAEFEQFFRYVEDGGYIFIHDLHQHMHQVPNEEHGFAWPYGLVPDSMKNLVKLGLIRPFHFETPRGLTGFYKVHPSDYKWV